MRPLGLLELELVLLLASHGAAASAAASAAGPSVALHANTNTVSGAGWRESGSGPGKGSIKYLGQYNTTAQCEWACLRGPPPYGSPCCAFTFHTSDYELDEPSGWNRQCFGIINSHWDPVAEQNITSGRVVWLPGTPQHAACTRTSPPPPAPPPPQPPPPSGPCNSALDCGLNGVCTSGVCRCRAAWTGDRCQALALLPASLDAGYRHVTVDGKNVSSWG